MLVTFFICRVLLFPYLYYAYGRYDHGLTQSFSLLLSLVFLSILPLSSCNVTVTAQKMWKPHLARTSYPHYNSFNVNLRAEVGPCMCTGMRPSHSTWCRCLCPGSVTLAQLCSWPHRSTGSPSSAGAPSVSSPEPRATGGPPAARTLSPKPHSCPPPTDIALERPTRTEEGVDRGRW